MSARGASLAARWLHEPQPISNQPVGLGFPHRAGRIDPGDLHFRSQVVRFVDVWKDFYPGMRTPGCAGSMYYPQPISHRPVASEAGVPHRAGRFVPGDHRFRPRIVGIVKEWKDF